MFGIDDAALAASAISYLGTQDTNQTRRDIANEANAFSAQQYATRYQTQVKDLEAAGLNPMLSYMQSPGSAPVGQQAQVENAVGSAVEGYQKSKERDLLSSQVAKVNSETAVNKKQADLIVQQIEESKSRERQADNSATESFVRAYSQMEYGNKSQKQLGDMHWSQMKVNENTLPLIASEIVRNGAHAAQARALAYKAIQEGNLSKAGLAGALNDKAFEESAAGRSKRFVEYGVNSAGKIVDMVKPFKSTTVRENGTTYDRNGNPVGGYSRNRVSK